MFSGIVEEVGIVRGRTQDCLTVEAKKVLQGTKVGDSIAVNGVCLTVVSVEARTFRANIMPETLRRTNLGLLQYNDEVNLERALALGGRLGGHLVLGHVDDTGKVIAVTSEGNARMMRISLRPELSSYVVNKGFVAVDGVSLTVVDLDEFSFTVSLVGYTLEHTTLGKRRVGNVVNLEVDIIGKYVEKLSKREKQVVDLDFLKLYGFSEAANAG
jgi:riboflavin synthase